MTPRDGNLLKSAAPRLAIDLETALPADAKSSVAEINEVNRSPVAGGNRCAPAGAGSGADAALERTRARNERWARTSQQNSDIKRRSRKGEPIGQIAASHGLSSVFAQRIAGAFGG